MSDSSFFSYFLEVSSLRIRSLAKNESYSVASELDLFLSNSGDEGNDLEFSSEVSDFSTLNRE